MNTPLRPAVAALAAAVSIAPSLQAQVPEGVEHRSTLTRVREGGTPFDAGQRMKPYRVSLATPGMRSGSGADIASPPEYAPVRGVLYQYGNSWNSVVTALVSSLTASPTRDEIAYVVVANQTTANSAASAFAAAGADMSKVVLIVQPNNSVWMRDYGPHFIFQGGTLAALDSHYYPGRPADNFIPTLVGRGLGLPVTHIPLYYSGGNFQAGPDRSGFVTALINLDNPSAEGFDEPFIRELHDTYKGIDTLHLMPQLPFSVDGTGHIDMWMYLVDQDSAIISQFISGSNSTAISVTNNAVPYMQDLGFEVFRPQAWNVGSTHYTYANAFRVNDRIFIPCYGTALAPGGNSAYNSRDADALSKWQAAAGPGVTIVPIQCSSIISASGAIHCIVKQVPRYTAPIPAVQVIAPAAGDVWPVGTTQVIRWNATDTDNRPLAAVDLTYSLDGGGTWLPIASGIADTGSYAWSVPEGAGSANALVAVMARSSGGAQVAATSNAYRQVRAVQRTYDFGTSAGVDRFGFGRQTTSWASVGTSAAPVATALSSANYAAMATSNASGGTSDSGRYVPPTVSSGTESTHVFRFTIAEPVSSIDELKVRWEGFADRCTQVELYVFNRRLGQWGDAAGLVGQNRFMANWAGNVDEVLEVNLRSNLSDFIGPDGAVSLLVYADRPADRVLHDWLQLTVTTVEACQSDANGDGTVDGADLGLMLAAWGPCSGCALDFNGDGAVDGIDLGLVLSAWGACP